MNTRVRNDIKLINCLGFPLRYSTVTSLPSLRQHSPTGNYRFPRWHCRNCRRSWSSSLRAWLWSGDKFVSTWYCRRSVWLLCPSRLAWRPTVSSRLCFWRACEAFHQVDWKQTWTSIYIYTFCSEQTLRVTSLATKLLPRNLRKTAPLFVQRAGAEAPTWTTSLADGQW